MKIKLRELSKDELMMLADHLGLDVGADLSNPDLAEIVKTNLPKDVTAKAMIEKVIYKDTPALPVEDTVKTASLSKLVSEKMPWENAELVGMYVQGSMPIDPSTAPKNSSFTDKLEIAISVWSTGHITWKILGPKYEVPLEYDRNQWGETVVKDLGFVDYSTEDKLLLDENNGFQSKVWKTWESNKETFQAITTNFTFWLEGQRVGKSELSSNAGWSQ